MNNKKDGLLNNRAAEHERLKYVCARLIDSNTKMRSLFRELERSRICRIYVPEDYMIEVREAIKWSEAIEAEARRKK
jgi:hypothetical protein